jgi:hypothetical protein
MANPYWDGKVHKAVKFGTDSTRAPLKAGRELRKERLASGEPGPSWSYYEPKSNPGVSGERFSDDSGVAEVGSINSGESFFTLPTALSTFHAAILSASKGRKRSIGGALGRRSTEFYSPSC